MHYRYTRDLTRVLGVSEARVLDALRRTGIRPRGPRGATMYGEADVRVLRQHIKDQDRDTSADEPNGADDALPSRSTCPNGSANQP